MPEYEETKLLENVLSRETIYEGAILTLQRWDVQLSSGKAASREVVVHKGAAAVVPVDENGRVAVVRQFRAPTGQILLEIPAGKLDFVGEDPLFCAKRELREETGLTAVHWNFLTSIYTTPGFSSEKISIYLATGLCKGPDSPDEDEFLSLEWIPLDSLVRDVQDAKIHDAKTCVAILLAHSILHSC